MAVYQGTIAGMRFSRRHFARTLATAIPAISAACAARSTPRLASPDFVALVEQVSPSIVSIGDGAQTVGSGFAVGPTLVITAAHVAQNAGRAIVVTSAQGRQPARLVGMDEQDDVALLEVSQPLPALMLATASPKVGEWILVLGNPFGSGMTATAGIVSAAPGSITATPILARQVQINAAVNPGNSGGPVCNLRGEVIGATTTLVAAGQGIAFATSAAALRSFLRSLGK